MFCPASYIKLKSSFKNSGELWVQWVVKLVLFPNSSTLINRSILFFSSVEKAGVIKFEITITVVLLSFRITWKPCWCSSVISEDVTSSLKVQMKYSLLDEGSFAAAWNPTARKAKRSENETFIVQKFAFVLGNVKLLFFLIVVKIIRSVNNI